MVDSYHKNTIESYKQALRIDPDDAEVHDNLGYAYVDINDRDSALEQYEILKSLDTEMANELLKVINEWFRKNTHPKPHLSPVISLWILRFRFLEKPLPSYLVGL